jgi:hypothetical protein
VRAGPFRMPGLRGRRPVTADPFRVLGPHGRRRPVTADPFRVLGLPLRPDLTDDDVRAAWRRIAAATHPDRADGGDPARYAEAAGAYTTLRTASGRGEAYADLTARRSLARVLGGRPAVLGLRVAACAAVSACVVAVAGFQPAAVALLAGIATWLVLTGRHDLAR